MLVRTQSGEGFSDSPIYSMQLSNQEGYDYYGITWYITPQKQGEDPGTYRQRLKSAAEHIADIIDKGMVKDKLAVIAIQGLPNTAEDLAAFQDSFVANVSVNKFHLGASQYQSRTGTHTFANKNVIEKFEQKNPPNTLSKSEIGIFDLVVKHKTTSDKADLRFINVNFNNIDKNETNRKIKQLTDSAPKGQVLIAGHFNCVMEAIEGGKDLNFGEGGPSGFHFKENPVDYNIQTKDKNKIPEKQQTEFESDSPGPVPLNKLLTNFPNTHYDTIKKGGVYTITNKSSKESITIEKISDRLKITANNSSETNLNDQIKAAASCFPKNAVININVTGGNPADPDHKQKIEAVKQQAWSKAIRAGFKVDGYRPEDAYIQDQIDNHGLDPACVSAKSPKP